VLPIPVISPVTVLLVIEERTKINIKGRKKNELPFQNWIFRNDQLVRDDDRRIFVAMTST
jgi:hypothetical protein